MPTYTYRCEGCDTLEDATVPIPNRDDTRVHSCGSPMVRVLSMPQPAIMKLTGKGMALDTLNSGKGLPSHAWYKNKYERLAAKGLEEPPKRVW
jgi:putative FmdB family regulatory protein